MKNIHFHFLVYEIGILFSLLTVGVCKSLSGVRMKVLGSEQGRAIQKHFKPLLSSVLQLSPRAGTELLLIPSMIVITTWFNMRLSDTGKQNKR